jgi:hypothetical protein
MQQVTLLQEKDLRSEEVPSWPLGLNSNHTMLHLVAVYLFSSTLFKWFLWLLVVLVVVEVSLR